MARIQIGDTKMKNMTVAEIKNLASKKGIDISSGDSRFNAPLGDLAKNGRLVMTKRNADALGLDYITHWYDSFGSVAMVKVK